MRSMQIQIGYKTQSGRTDFRAGWNLPYDCDKILFNEVLCNLSYALYNTVQTDVILSGLQLTKDNIVIEVKEVYDYQGYIDSRASKLI